MNSQYHQRPSLLIDSAAHPLFHLQLALSWPIHGMTSADRKGIITSIGFSTNMPTFCICTSAHMSK